MSAWTNDELASVEAAQELRITTLRPDGAPRKALPVWVVRVGDDLYVRSAYGPGSAWYRAANARGEGRISAGGVDKHVAFEEADHDLDDQVDTAYRDKYGRHSSIVDSMITPEIRATTIRLVPLAA
jgi:hypothetical protein